MHRDTLIFMDNGAASCTTFVVDTPFDSALVRIRRAIRAGRLAVAAEIDAAQRVKRALDIDVPPCRVLLVDNPAFMLETTAIDRASGIYIPLHLVVSAAGDRTLIYMLNLEHIRYSDVPIGVKAPVLDLQRQVIRSLSKVAERARGGREASDRGESRALVASTTPT